MFITKLYASSILHILNNSHSSDPDGDHALSSHSCFVVPGGFILGCCSRVPVAGCALCCCIRGDHLRRSHYSTVHFRGNDVESWQRHSLAGKDLAPTEGVGWSVAARFGIVGGNGNPALKGK